MSEVKTKYEEHIEALLTDPDLWEASDTETLTIVGNKLLQEFNELVEGLFYDLSKSVTPRREGRISKEKLRLEKLTQDIPFLMDVLEEIRRNW